MSFTLVVHGGAGNITSAMLNKEKEEQYRNALKHALDTGTAILQKGGAALDAVIATVVSLEDNPLFNAGRGSVFTKKGVHEMDAALMDGSNLAAGAVAGVRNIKNPIKLAHEIMLYSGHVFLGGKGAGEFALKQGIQLEPDEYFFNKERYEQWVALRDSDFYQLDHKADNLKGKTIDKEYKFGTVGAAACDLHGNLAAATSTGGMTNKRFGRIGDSPVIGAGTYANNNSCAISCTGHGEYFLRAVAAHDVSCLMEYKGLSLHDACHTVIMDKLAKMGGEGGLIAVDSKDNYDFCFNTAGMFRGMKNSGGEELITIYG